MTAEEKSAVFEGPYNATLAKAAFSDYRNEHEKLKQGEPHEPLILILKEALRRAGFNSEDNIGEADNYLWLLRQ